MIAFLRLIPAWAWIALLLGAGLWYGSTRYNAGEAAAEARHAAVMQDLRDQTAEAARAAEQARTEYEQRARGDKARHDQEKTDAFNRGQAAGAAIAAGDQRVRVVWRDRQCPAADAGEGAEPAGGHPDVTPGRADAIGRVLGYGWQWDADYALAVGRLNAAQGLLNQCYEEPAQ